LYNLLTIVDVFLEMKIAWNELGDSDLIVYQIIQGPQESFFPQLNLQIERFVHIFMAEISRKIEMA